jgi:2-polyprenyl-3-methyl-5-hydroxy-6-metoxy-1,4-benzoquinol methylase
MALHTLGKGETQVQFLLGAPSFMHISSVSTQTHLYYDLIRTTKRKTIVDDAGVKIKEVIEYTYQPYTKNGQIDSTQQIGENIDQMI